MQLFEQRHGSVGQWRQKQQRGRGVNIALCMLEGSSIPEQGEECFLVRCQCRQQPTDHKKWDDCFAKMKNCQSDTCKTKLTLGNVGQQKQKAKDCRAGASKRQKITAACRNAAVAKDCSCGVGEAGFE
jgi:hypothetical protein